MQNFVLIGDVHSQYRPLWEALAYCQHYSRIPVLLGDLFDSRCEMSDSLAVYELVRHAQEEMGAVVLRSNHQDKLERFLKGNKVQVSLELQRTLDDFEGQDLKELLNWLQSLPYGFCFKQDGQEYRCAHAYFPSWVEVPEYTECLPMHEMTKKARQLAMYGPSHQEGNGRVFWWERESDRDWVRVAGHYHVVHEGKNSLVLDGGCGGTQRSWFCTEDPCLVAYDVATKETLMIKS